jgi:hypothetical protein
LSRDASALFEGKGAAPAASSVEVIVKLAEEAKRLDETIKGIEELLASANERKNEITQFELPAALKDAGTTIWSSEPDEDGNFVEVKLVDYISGSLPNKEKEPEKRAQALKYLESEEDTAALIKTQLNVEFGKGDHNVATDIAESIRDRGYPVSLDLGVHPATLKSYVTEALRTGKNIDLELLGVSRMTVAKYAVKKDKKKRKKS